MDRYGADGDSTLNIDYEASVETDDLRPASDISDAVWFPLDQPPDPIAFDNNRQALDALRSLYV
jgi:hypothetical protein